MYGRRWHCVCNVFNGKDEVAPYDLQCCCETAQSARKVSRREHRHKCSTRQNIDPASSWVRCYGCSSRHGSGAIRQGCHLDREGAYIRLLSQRCKMERVIELDSRDCGVVNRTSWGGGVRKSVSCKDLATCLVAECFFSSQRQAGRRGLVLQAWPISNVTIVLPRCSPENVTNFLVARDAVSS
jgi:hypothetical protein